MTQISIVKKSELEGAMRLDAEYYQPEYFSLLDKIKHSGSTVEMLGDLTIEKVHRGVLPEYSNIPEIPVLNTDTVRNDFIFLDGCSYTTRDFYDKNPRGVVKPFDIVMTSTGRGTLGRVNVFNEDCRAFADGHISIIRTKNMDSYYLYAFLTSKYGQFQINRAYTGSTGQIEIYPDQIEAFLIVVPDEQHQKSTREFVYESHNLKRKSEYLYLKAEQILLDEVGFKELDLSHQLYYTVPYKKAREVDRFDAEHFQPKYERLIEHLTKAGKSVKLKDVLNEPVKKGLTPEYVSDGDILVVNSQHLGRYSLNIEATDRTSEGFWRQNKRAQVKPMDVMVYATGAYIGRTNIWPVDYKAVAGVDILLIRPSKVCNPYYLSVYINSPLGILQAEKFASGSGQRHIYPDDVAQFVVYLPSIQSQQRIAELVIQSWETRKKARQLLEKAKQTVKNIVEYKNIDV